MTLRPRADLYAWGHPTATDVLVESGALDGRGRRQFARLWSPPQTRPYARYGVAEVWIVDLVGRALEIFQGPLPGEGGDGDANFCTRLVIDVVALLV